MPFESLGAVSYSPSIVTMAVSVAVCEIPERNGQTDRRTDGQICYINIARQYADTHSLTAALDQLRVVASSTSNDPDAR